MNLLSELIKNGVTFNVANAKKGDIAEKAIKMSMPSSKVEIDVNYDIKLTRKNGKEIFTVSQNLIDKMPTISDKGVGFKSFYTNDAYLLLCTEEDDIKPVMYNVKKGEVKSNTFKADAFVYSLLMTNLITAEEGEWKFNLELKEDNLYQVVESIVDITFQESIDVKEEGEEVITFEEEDFNSEVAGMFISEENEIKSIEEVDITPEIEAVLEETVELVAPNFN